MKFKNAGIKSDEAPSYIKFNARQQLSKYPKESKDDAVIAQALAILKSRMSLKGNEISKQEDAISLFTLRIGDKEREIFSVAYLDNKHRVIEVADEALGTISSASVYPREIAKSALRLNAAAVILAHNHPSGVTYPSQSDKDITKRIVEAMSLIDVRVLDHVIVAIGTDAYSFAENNLI